MRSEIANRILAGTSQDVKEEVDNYANKLALCHRSGSACELPTGVYQVGVDKAAPNSKDHSCRVWMKKGISGEMIIVAVEHYR